MPMTESALVLILLPNLTRFGIVDPSNNGKVTKGMKHVTKCPAKRIGESGGYRYAVFHRHDAEKFLGRALDDNSGHALTGWESFWCGPGRLCAGAMTLQQLGQTVIVKQEYRLDPIE